MIDYILNFPTEQDAIDFFKPIKDLNIYNDGWDTSRVILNIEIIEKSALYDKDGLQTASKIIKPRFWMWVSLDKIYDNVAKQSFAYGSELISSKLVNNLMISPVPMGRNYIYDKI